MKQKTIFLAASLLLVLLLNSSVRASSSGGYTLGRFVVSSGGQASSGGDYVLAPGVVPSGGAIASTGGVYALGSTVGQIGAGRVSGGSYTIYGGFWRPGTVVDAPPAPIYVPMARRSPPPPPPTPPPVGCPDVEPNNDPDPGHYQFLTTINASCIGLFQNEPPGNSDYYGIHLSMNQHIIVKLTGIPAGANYDLALIRQDGLHDFRPVATSAKLGQADELIDYVADSNKPYFIRVRLITKSLSATNTYILSVAIS
jgi:hypothetical protein